jgi:hypothetical protein
MASEALQEGTKTHRGEKKAWTSPTNSGERSALGVAQFRWKGSIRLCLRGQHHSTSAWEWCHHICLSWCWSACMDLLAAAKTATTATALRNPGRASIRTSAARGRSSKGSVATHGRGSKRTSRRASATHGRRSRRPTYASGRKAEGSVATH